MFRNPTARPAALRCLRLAVPPGCLCSFLRADPTPVRRPGVIKSDNPQVAHFGWRRPGLPGSWKALACVPCSRTPAGPLRQAFCGVSVWPSAFSTASAPAITLLTGLNHTARTLAVYASPWRLPDHDARLATGWVANPSRAGLSPAGLQRKVSAHASPFPRLILAQAKRSHRARCTGHAVCPVHPSNQATKGSEDPTKGSEDPAKRSQTTPSAQSLASSLTRRASAKRTQTTEPDVLGTWSAQPTHRTRLQKGRMTPPNEPKPRMLMVQGASSVSPVLTGAYLTSESPGQDQAGLAGPRRPDRHEVSRKGL